jgi:hypothetical protein
VLAELLELAGTPRGRRLLQLALRGIQESGHGLTYGCWVQPGAGVSGCLFQHAYWQGVAEGVFAPAGAGNDVKGGIRAYVGEEDFALVMGAIRAFDGLGRRRFRRWRRGPYGLPRLALDERAWRAAVERLLVDALASTAPGPAGVREPAGGRTPGRGLGARA